VAYLFHSPRTVVSSTSQTYFFYSSNVDDNFGNFFKKLSGSFEHALTGMPPGAQLANDSLP